MTKARWFVGTNMPGYMPDSDPAEFSNWSDAHRALVAELESDVDGQESAYGSDSETDSHVATIVADIAETIGRAKRCRRFSEFGETVNNRHYWLSRA